LPGRDLKRFRERGRLYGEERDDCGRIETARGKGISSVHESRSDPHLFLMGKYERA
jgi:hypothetical protein